MSVSSTKKYIYHVSIFNKKIHLSCQYLQQQNTFIISVSSTKNVFIMSVSSTKNTFIMSVSSTKKYIYHVSIFNNKIHLSCQYLQQKIHLSYQNTPDTFCLSLTTFTLRFQDARIILHERSTGVMVKHGCGD